MVENRVTIRGLARQAHEKRRLVKTAKRGFPPQPARCPRHDLALQLPVHLHVDHRVMLSAGVGTELPLLTARRALMRCLYPWLSHYGAR